ncbi:MAG TPA: hypothetical protein VNX28_11110 [Gemmataceae bacterium]|nr:hypothetical protein [Gemmataceae bacterium]
MSTFKNYRRAPGRKFKLHTDGRVGVTLRPWIEYSGIIDVAGVAGIPVFALLVQPRDWCACVLDACAMQPIRRPAADDYNCPDRASA